MPAGPRGTNAPIVQPPRAYVTNVELCNVIQMFSHAMTAQVDGQGAAPIGRQGIPDILGSLNFVG